MKRQINATKGTLENKGFFIANLYEWNNEGMRLFDGLIRATEVVQFKKLGEMRFCGKTYTVNFNAFSLTGQADFHRLKWYG